MERRKRPYASLSARQQKRRRLAFKGCHSNVSATDMKFFKSSPQESDTDTSVECNTDETMNIIEGILKVETCDLPLIPDPLDLHFKSSGPETTNGEKEGASRDQTRPASAVIEAKIVSAVQNWIAEEKNISHSVITSLLKHLNHFFPGIPVSAQAILGNCESTKRVGMENGHSANLENWQDGLNGNPSPHGKVCHSSALSSKKSRSDLFTELQSAQRKIERKIDLLKEVCLGNSHMLHELTVPKNVAHFSDEPGLIFNPASTLEELNEILTQKNIHQTLERLEDVTLAATLRNMLKKTLSRSLAMQFSFTGLNVRRERVKICLRDHALYEALNRAIDSTSYRNTNRMERERAIKDILKNAADWEGHRSLRQKPTYKMCPSIDPLSISSVNDGPASSLEQAESSLLAIV